MRDPKFNFISEDLISLPAKENLIYKVSLIRGKQKFKTSNGSIKEIPSYSLYFGKEVVNVYDLAGKRLKFYVDPQKKSIGWRILEGNISLEELNTGRVVKPMTSGVWTVSITSLVNYAKIDIPATRSSIPVKTYKPQAEYLSYDLSYIEL